MAGLRRHRLTIGLAASRSVLSAPTPAAPAPTVTCVGI
ncbi:hypothetical protein SLEP1_g10677 [Rubroshorea leprosula]|uniref:Uncharacterized protein n=1 Tax=Rubroshorea leprosula TaxID=152421 RepID=A0AAV5IIP6_9ROSI|nr:hypothetical protein SLEP1_g10677 [Rubroshorea leprosula]